MKALLLLSLVVAWSSAAAEDLSGVVHLANGKPASQAVVFLEGSEKSHPLAHAMVDQKDRMFTPHVSVVTVGTTVQFPNHDTIFHNVFTEFHSTKFDLGMYPRGTSKSQKFERTGLAVLLCSVHPDMSAFVMVVDTPYYTITDSHGRYKFANVPAGRYSLNGWHESGQKQMKPIEISGAQTEDIALRR